MSPASVQFAPFSNLYEVWQGMLWRCLPKTSGSRFHNHAANCVCTLAPETLWSLRSSHLLMFLSRLPATGNLMYNTADALLSHFSTYLYLLRHLPLSNQRLLVA